VIGDPFDPALAAEVAELEGSAALAALDDLLGRALVRPAATRSASSTRRSRTSSAVWRSPRRRAGSASCS
jgi:hypothetical protein